MGQEFAGRAQLGHVASAGASPALTRLGLWGSRSSCPHLFHPPEPSSCDLGFPTCGRSKVVEILTTQLRAPRTRVLRPRQNLENSLLTTQLQKSDKFIIKQVGEQKKLHSTFQWEYKSRICGSFRSIIHSICSENCFISSCPENWELKPGKETLTLFKA